MRIRSLNCVSMCPPGRRLMDGRAGAHGPAVLVCHCLLVETGDRVILVDTGFGLEDVRHPERLSTLFRKVLCRPRLREEDTAVRQLAGLGIHPEEVTDIVLTHLDFDHAGGLDDFPRATIHLLEAEAQAAELQRTWHDRARFRPSQWASRDRWRTYAPTGERWKGFDAVSELAGLPPELLLVPLPGHTVGHAGIAVRDGERWLLHAGDAYFFRDEMHPSRPRCTPGLRFYQWFMEVDRRLRLDNQERLRELRRRHGGDVRIFCAHDLVELEALARAQGSALKIPTRPDARARVPRASVTQTGEEIST